MMNSYGRLASFRSLIAPPLTREIEWVWNVQAEQFEKRPVDK
jgi:hypothetical protein|nr:hypothetical protein [uncultured Undibacterium sp.]